MLLRICSALVLIPIFFSCIWFLGPVPLLLVAEAVLVLAFIEYARLAAALGARLSSVVSGAAAAAVCAAVALDLPLDLPLAAALVAIGSVAVGARVPGKGVLNDVAAAAFPMLYLGLPLGCFVALHASAGRKAVLLLLLTVIVSDSGQYFAGRLFGRHKLSPVISPKKTLEGAVGGFVLAPVVLAWLGRWWLPQISTERLLLFGVAIVGLGIAGDLFESLLKRSAGIKDSSTLIPGHGGVLDRIDALLFTVPAFHVFLKYSL
ncbi:MAG TPA: phosphatidate cytidylyltransferase [Vicinamibacterales bacterium]|jgi:phosphatidate cytidylyltransferase